MGYNYTTRNGHRVEVNVAAAFDRMAAAFKRDTGCTLLINSGTRTAQDQIDIFLRRYVRANQVNGRRVYDTRVWGGTRFYRIDPTGTVGTPGTSNHEEYGPNGPRSLDVYDSCSDPGVSRFGTARTRWMEQHAWEYGFENEGHKFNEAWHKTYRGPIGGPAPAGSGSTSGEVVIVPKEDEEMYSVQVNGKIYGLATQFITHYGTVSQATTTRQVTSATDELHKLNLGQFVDLLDGLGIPRDVLDKDGYVKNPQSTAVNKFENNGTWSREREILASLEALKAVK